MNRSMSKFALKIVCASIFLAWLCVTAGGQPVYNSPKPVLLSRIGLAGNVAKTGADAKQDAKTFLPGTRIQVYVENIGSSILKNEGANSFRLYAADPNGNIYRFTGVETFKSSILSNGIGIIFVLKDEAAYWKPPVSYDKMKIWLTWRGRASNVIQLDLDPAQAKTGPTRTPDVKSGPSTEFSPLYSPDRARFIQQATFGYTLALDNQVRTRGIANYIDDQFTAAYPTFPYPAQPLQPPFPPARCNGTPPDLTSQPQDPVDVPETCFRDTYSMYPLQQWFLQEAFYGDDQLRNRVAWALSQIWVTSGVELRQSRHMTEYYKILYENAFGNYRTIMEKMTLNPAMGDYLDMSVSTNASPNENYPRELMQLFSTGVFMLNQDGSELLDGNGQKVPVYNQERVEHFARVFTGWNFCNVGCPNSALGAVNFIDPMSLTPARHNLDAKTLLSYPGSTTTSIAPCGVGCDIPTYANDSLIKAIKNVFEHPNVPPFVSRQLIQHLVESDPSPGYVQRVADKFVNNGAGVRGDLKEVIRTILLDPEARGDTKEDPFYGKLREPVQFATNFLRPLNVKGNGFPQSDGIIFTHDKFKRMSQVPFYSPSVFNYYSPKNVILIDGPQDALAPEFMLMTPTTAIARPNFAYLIVFSGMDVNPNWPEYRTAGTTLDLSDLATVAQFDTSCQTLLDALNERLMNGSMSTDMRNAILPAVTAISSSDPLGRAKEAVYLVVTSSQFQVQR